MQDKVKRAHAAGYRVGQVLLSKNNGANKVKGYKNKLTNAIIAHDRDRVLEILLQLSSTQTDTINSNGTNQIGDFSTIYDILDTPDNWSDIAISFTSAMIPGSKKERRKINMKKSALTLTVVANITSNYGEGLGNASNVQKIYKNQKEYAIRSRESLKNAICVQAGLYDDLETVLDSVAQKKVTEELNVSNCRALEGGYMSTKGESYIRNSSFYLTDAIAVDSLINELRFHNNLYLANTYAKENNLCIQSKTDKTGLNPYQYEYDKSLKVYSITIDLDKIGVDENFHAEADNSEKAFRVNAILDAIANLSLIVKGNLDNAEPLFVIGGLSCRKTHFFENVVNVKNASLILEDGIKEKLHSEKGDFHAGVLKCGIFANENDIVRELNAMQTEDFFKQL